VAGNTEAVLLMTHFLGGGIIDQYHRLAAEAGRGRDVVLLYNRGDDPKPGRFIPPAVAAFPFDADDVRGLGFPAKGRRPSAWDVELFALLFAARHPRYQRWWVVEYDVDFTGRWSALFDAFADDGADLLATTLHRHPVNPGWPNWKTVRAPEGRPPPETMVRGFLPCYRMTRRAADALQAAYLAGWRGHYEATVPTILDRSGLVIEDIGGDGEFVAEGNRNRFYTNNPAVDSLAPGSFVFRPVRAAPGGESGLLWHPVKPPSLANGWATGRRATLSRWLRSTLRTPKGWTA